MMLLLPEPRKISAGNGNFVLSSRTEIILDNTCSYGDFEAAELLQKEIRAATSLHTPINKAFKKDEGECIYIRRDGLENGEEAYNLLISGNGIEITGGGSSGVFYGIQTLRQIVRQSGSCLPCGMIEDYPYFKNRGYLFDVTRGKTPTLDTLKELVDRLSFYKINHLQLYMEHTFAFKRQSEIWVKTDPITAEEILALDEYCKRRHIELVPAIATFSHLYDVLSSNSFKELCELEADVGKPFTWYNRMRYHMLDASNPESVKFVKDMLDEFLPLFSSDKFNICCDETFDLGRGKSKAAADRMGKGHIYVDFVKKIIEHVKGHGKKAMFWGDIVLKHPDCISELPEDVTFLNWDYFDVKEENIKAFHDRGLEQYVCPSVSGFSRLVNELDLSFRNISQMVGYGMKYKAAGVLNTDWGDSGHINFFTSSMPGMIYGAALSWNPDSNSKDDIDVMDRKISIIEYKDESGSLIGLIRQLCRQDKIIWNNIAFWRDERVYGIPMLEAARKEFAGCSEEELVNAVTNASRLAGEILLLSKGTAPDHSTDMEEFYLSARGVALMEALSLIIKKLEFKQEIKQLAYSPWELAAFLEYWLYDFCRLWRIRNKESELGRIKEAFIQICDILRRYKH